MHQLCYAFFLWELFDICKQKRECRQWMFQIFPTNCCSNWAEWNKLKLQRIPQALRCINILQFMIVMSRVIHTHILLQWTIIRKSFWMRTVPCKSLTKIIMPRCMNCYKWPLTLRLDLMFGTLKFWIIFSHDDDKISMLSDLGKHYMCSKCLLSCIIYTWSYSDRLLNSFYLLW